MENHADLFFDIRECISPIILMKACHAVREMKKGETIQILLRSTVSKEDLFKILPASRYDIVSNRKTESFYRIISKRLTLPSSTWRLPSAGISSRAIQVTFLFGR